MRRPPPPLLLACLLCAQAVLNAACGGAGRWGAHPKSFYHWKAKVSIGETERRYFAGLGCERLYMRFFDVDAAPSGGSAPAAPMAKVEPFDGAALAAEYVPTVFITNRTFVKMPPEGRVRLARNVSSLVESVRSQNKLAASGEIHVDCDWTAGTRDAYFAFLEELRAASGKDVSCTLRLHQIKFRGRAGVPPVAKAVLMCYATSDPGDGPGRNSILDMALLKDYMEDAASYPLDFDVALPLYSWAVVTNHLGEVKLVNDVAARDLGADAAHFQYAGGGEYRVKEDFFFRGLYLNKGFSVRVEGVSPELLREAKGYLDGKLRRGYGIVYYHLDRPFLEAFSIRDLE
ncbi:MAG: hypothetical protein LBT74_13600 [Acidobacteriota bacterium]|jgi:hypothetical protein|nr:hypothetical protein [Acidobacteriota bacterium]